MSYHLYQTEGLILSGRNVGEAGRYLSLFTKELGLVNAMVLGARKLESKLRYHLENYTLGNFNLVRGREIWRLVGAEKIACLKDPITARISLLLRRLIAGEEKDAGLFQDVRQACLFLDQSSHTRDVRDGLEIILVLRILDRLGYLKKESKLLPFIQFEDWESFEIAIPPLLKGELTNYINQALKATQL